MNVFMSTGDIEKLVFKNYEGRQLEGEHRVSLDLMTLAFQVSC